MSAASVNPADWRIRAGQLRLFLRLRLPFVPGSDVAGTVVQVGDGVDAAWQGLDAYAALPTRQGGGYAELVVVDIAHHLAAVPRGLSPVETAALPLCGLTALQALRKAASETESPARPRRLRRGRHHGRPTRTDPEATVTAVTSTPDRDLVANLGVHRVLDYTQDGLTSQEGSFDVVLDAADALPVRTGLHLSSVRPARTGLVPEVEDEPLTITEVAEMLRVPVATLRRWRHLGQGPHSFRIGRAVRYWRGEVLPGSRSRATDPTPTPPDPPHGSSTGRRLG